MANLPARRGPEIPDRAREPHQAAILAAGACQESTLRSCGPQGISGREEIGVRPPCPPWSRHQPGRG
jgi:hypothetical protein